MSIVKQDDELIRSDIEGYLASYQNKELLRFVAVGSVDDGKSTLIGRLLHDTGMVYEDQLQSVRKATAIEGEDIDFSLFTDGLRAEREQGITIDVAYRYFSTAVRKFIIADTPGHVQYTRNMVTGASTAHVALILIDARLGVLQQSRRHAYIASLLGIPNLAVCINKMDLVGYDQHVFERIKKNFSAFSDSLAFKEVSFFPISALKGSNIVSASPHTAWYTGPTVLGYLETVALAEDQNPDDFRFPVQTVIRPHLDYRGFAGKIVSGSISRGDEIITLPSGKRSHVSSIDTFDGELEQACANQSVTIRLDDEIDISRGDMLVKANSLPSVGRSVDASLVWMNEKELDSEKSYILKHTTQSVRVQIDKVHWKKDMDTLKEVEASTLGLNDIGKVSLSCHRAIYFDAYTKNRNTGAFILIDSLSNDTVAAGMIGPSTTKQEFDEALRELRAGSALKPKSQISRAERMHRLGQHGAVVWLTGLPGSGRWTLAYALERRLFDLGCTATVIDPTQETLSSMISSAKAVTHAGLIAICAFPSYKHDDREAVRSRIGDQRFVQVYVNTSLELCKERRPGADFSGFEEPANPEVTVALDHTRIEQAVDFIISALKKQGRITI
ncbi:MAG: sulfate adenylyltransferase subunit CysN [Myxococcales bacterium]|nr:MAG: sulfate adenylyltransferase subunit CysN [Myxococcales bacterium]